ncbi:MAG: hypothetical protein EA357_08845 [Micavibrio sp.]|nr:MAG: hypothetical protein EA357_08845 [Micavibrio sp.]
MRGLRNVFFMNQEHTDKTDPPVSEEKRTKSLRARPPKTEKKKAETDAPEKQKPGVFWRFSAFCGHCLRETLVIAVTVIVFALAFVNWKLAQGPVPLDFAAPHLEKAFQDNFPDMRIEIGSTALVWTPRDASIVLHIRDLHLYESDPEPAFILKESAVEISKRDLLLGQLKIKTLMLEGLALRVTRTEDGAFSLSFRPKEAGEAEDYTYTAYTEAAQDETDTPPRFDPRKIVAFDKLKTVSLKNTDISFHDATSGTSWQGSAVDLFLVRGQGVLTGSLRADITLDSEQESERASAAFTNTELNFYYSLAENQLRITVFFEGVNPRAAAPHFPDIPALSALNADLRGKIDLYFDDSLEPAAALVEIRSAYAELITENIYDNPKELRDIKGVFHYDAPNGKIDVRQLEFSFSEEARGSLNGQISFSEDTETESGFYINALLENLAVDVLKDYWPPALEPDAYEWVTQHLSRGTADHAELRLSGELRSGENGGIPLAAIDSVAGEITFSGITVDYLPDLSVIRNVRGRAAFTQDEFIIHTEGGMLRDLPVKNAVIRISDITGKPNIRIEAGLSGPVGTALTVLGQKPLEFTQMFNFDTEKTGGRANIDMTLSFPLKTGLGFGDVELSANAQLEDVHIPGFLDDYDLTQGVFTLSVDSRAMALEGNGILGEAPVRFTWDNNFKDTGNAQHRISGHIGLTAPMLRHYFDLPPEHLEMFFPELPTEFTYTRMHGTENSTVTLAANVTAAEIAIPALRYTKSREKSGTVGMFVHLNRHRQPERITGLTVDLPGLRVEGEISLTRKNDGSAAISSADIRNFQMGDTQFSAEIRQADSELPRIRIKGPYINAAAFLPDEKDKDKTAPPKTGRPYEMRIDAARLSLNPDKHIDEIQLFLRKDKNGITDQLEIDGIAGEGEIHYRFFPQDGGYGMRFEADNAGAALSALGIMHSIRGGRLVIRGVPVQGGGKYDIHGRAELSNFAVVDMPVLARLLNAFSPGGLQDLMTGDGMNFSRMRADFTWIKQFAGDGHTQISEVVTVKNGRTSGASLGLTFEGDIDRTNDMLNISGTIVPAAILNKIVSGIPVIGTLLTGGSGSVFAATYTIRGPKDRVEVMVNPLATLAPGILRMMLFED